MAWSCAANLQHGRIEAVDCRVYAALKICHCELFNEQEKLTWPVEILRRACQPATRPPSRATSKAGRLIQYLAVELLG